MRRRECDSFKLELVRGGEKNEDWGDDEIKEM